VVQIPWDGRPILHRSFSICSVDPSANLMSGWLNILEQKKYPILTTLPSELKFNGRGHGLHIFISATTTLLFLPLQDIFSFISRCGLIYCCQSQFLLSNNRHIHPPVQIPILWEDKSIKLLRPRLSLKPEALVQTVLKDLYPFFGSVLVRCSDTLDNVGVATTWDT
jgi:hypothetical protein